MAGLARSNEQVLLLIAEQKLTLELSTLELGFLVALHLHARAQSLTSFSETLLEDICVQASHVLLPEADQRKRRATHAIKRLREQRLLSRVDGSGIARAGEFALSRLALGIVDFYLEDGVLTRESLLLLTGSLRLALDHILQAARQAADRQRWQDEVVGPLSVSVSELVDGIERRQRGLDLQQEDFRADIRRLLEADWFAALERCQSLLDSASATLQELNQVLLRDSGLLLGQLQDIEELAIAAEQPAAEAAARRVMDQVDRIAAWGAARQRAFSDYFQYVHRYLRDVVRLDPARALTQRLRDQLAGQGARFALTYASAGPMTLLRTVMPVPEKPNVTRPRAPREKELAAAGGEDPDAVLTTQVRDALARGATALSSVTAEVTEELPLAERFLQAGRIAHKVAELARAQSEVERDWVPAGDGLVIEEWSLERSPESGAVDE
jgi:chromosome partition protein MukF